MILPVMIFKDKLRMLSNKNSPTVPTSVAVTKAETFKSKERSSVLITETIDKLKGDLL